MNIGISVVIPTFNCLHYLPDALDSVWQQSSPADEVWVVDDGSTDDTLCFLQQQQLLHPSLHILRLEGVGVAAARNAAIDLCQHPYVAFLDADDSWDPDKLYHQRRLLRQQPDCGLLFSNYMHINESNQLICDCFGYWPHFRQLADEPQFQVSLDNLMIENVIGTSCVVAKRDLLRAVGGFDRQLGSASDWDMWLKLANVAPVWTQSELLMNYLMRKGSISSNRKQRLIAMDTIIQRHRTSLSRRRPYWLAKATLAIGYAEFHQHQRQFLQALKHQAKAMLLSPSLSNSKVLLKLMAQWLRPQTGN